MLIRSSFVSLVLAATLSSAAHCASAARAPLIMPTRDPVPAEPQQVYLKLVSDEMTCAAAYKVETKTSGALQVAFDDLLTDAAQGKFRAYCRLGGTIVIPKGYGLEPSLALTARVRGELKGGIDNVTGRLRITLGRYAGRDFELTEYAGADSETPIQTVSMDLKTLLPEVPTSCTEDLTWPVSLFVESTINGRASSHIEELTLDSLNLVPLTCNR